jgi:hypothetical protein
MTHGEVAGTTDPWAWTQTKLCRRTPHTVLFIYLIWRRCHNQEYIALNDRIFNEKLIWNDVERSGRNQTWRPIPAFHEQTSDNHEKLRSGESPIWDFEPRTPNTKQECYLGICLNSRKTEENHKYLWIVGVSAEIRAELELPISSGIIYKFHHKYTKSL